MRDPVDTLARIDTYEPVSLRMKIGECLDNRRVTDDRIDPIGPEPPYKQIAAILRERIESGRYGTGTRIPTESELVETYEVARSTARRAIEVLRKEGLVYTVPGRGTYVGSDPNV